MNPRYALVVKTTPAAPRSDALAVVDRWLSLNDVTVRPGPSIADGYGHVHLTLEPDPEERTEERFVRRLNEWFVDDLNGPPFDGEGFAPGSLLSWSVIQ